MYKSVKNKVLVLFCIVLINLLGTFNISFAEKNETIKVGWFYLPGYMEKDNEGNYCGYIFDYLMKIKEYTNFEYDFIEGDCEELVDEILKNKIDILPLVSQEYIKSEKIRYTSIPIGEESLNLYTFINSDLAENDYKEFDGITIGTVNDSLVEGLDVLAKEKKFSYNIKKYDSNEALRDDVIKQNVDAGLSVAYYSDEKTREIANFNKLPFYLGTNYKNKELLKELDNAISTLKLYNQDYEKMLKDKHLSKGYSYFTLTKEEKDFVNKSKTFKVSYTKEWAPYESMKNNEFIGIVSKIFERIEELTNLKFEYYPTNKSGGNIDGIDIISSFEYNYERAQAEGYNMTMPYLETPLVVIKKDSNPSINLKTGVSKYYYSSKNKAVDTSLLHYYSETKDCIDAIYKGEVEQAIVSDLYADNILDEYRYKGYKSIPLKSEKLKLSIGIREDINPILINILNKSISFINEEEIENIIISETLASKKISLKNIYDNMSFEVIIVICASLFIMILILVYSVVNKDKYIKRIKQILYYDELTNLLSSAGFEKKVSEILKESNQNYYIVYFNIINFSSYNSINGREKADELICKIAKTINSEADKNVLAARIYADNFILCIKENNYDDFIKQAYNRVEMYQDILSKLNIEIKFGIYNIKDRNIPVKNMIDNAIFAEESIKDKSDVYVAVYNSILHEENLKNDELISYFNEAIQKDEFVLHYQPKYDTFSEKIVGAEALVRWMRNGKLKYPNEFIDIFEKSGKIGQLDMHIFEKVCQKQRYFLDKGVKIVPISVNFSRANLYDFKFIPKLENIIKKYDIRPQLLEIEFTEDSLIQDIKPICEVLNKLKDMGFAISIDDFGSGYSSLNSLKDLPVDILKIDRGFITYSEEDYCAKEKGQFILKKIIDLSKKLNMVTVVEGVEEVEQLKFLRECKCDIIQGYIFSKPIPEDDFEKLLK